MSSSESYREWMRGRHRPAHGRRSAERNAGFFLLWLKPGMRLLDVGCGPGSITIGLAARVAPGEVVGLDHDPDGIELARQLATSRDVKNAQFAVGSAYHLPFEDQAFDGALLHAVVQHLRDPVAALREIHRVMRPGAVIGIGDADLAMDVVHPATPAMVESMQLFADIRRADGGTPDAGRRLRDLLNLAGFVRCTASARALDSGTAEGIARIGMNWADYFGAEPLIEHAQTTNLASREQLLDIANDWRTWSTNPSAFCSAIWCEAVGWK